MSRSVMMVGKDTERFTKIGKMLEHQGDSVSHLRAIPDRLGGSVDLLLIAYSEIPQDGENLPQGIPVLGYRFKDQTLRKHIPNIEVLSEEGTSDGTVVERIHAKIDEADYDKQMVLKYRDLAMDLRTGRISVSGDRISLSSNEYKILRYLMENMGSVVSREQIIRQVWGPDSATETKAVEVYISHIREKIDDVYGKTYISTIRGKGYSIGWDKMKQL